jgi:hypothetical protein
MIYSIIVTNNIHNTTIDQYMLIMIHKKDNDL